VGGAEHLIALNGGYHLAFLGGALFAALAAVAGLVFMRTRDMVEQVQGEPS
jgi:hypothetical protein